MCGLMALFGRSDTSLQFVQLGLARMASRGPDGEGIWQDEDICFGHRRLAILDLNKRADQPMHSACGRYVIVFNGEVYNFCEIRRELQASGITFATDSDTEVLLALFARDGERMLPKLAGMFAFVIWDKVTRRAFVARDPYGIKPLYVGKFSGGVILASQVKALLSTGLVTEAVNPIGQAGFWLLGSVPEPYTLYRDIQALPAGHYAWVEDNQIGDPVCWWDIADAWRSTNKEKEEYCYVQDSVRNALLRSVDRHMTSDVPVGVFLSGGIDSGALAALMVENGARDLQGVTVAYDEFSGTHQDEAPVAALIAQHYGIRHHIRKVSRDEFLEDLPLIFDAMDQPSVDGVNTWFASKAVSELGLKVVVSGVGGDELFQGYRTFDQLPRLIANWKRFSAIPLIRRMGGWLAALQARRSGNARWLRAADLLLSIQGAWWLKRGVHAPEELIRLMNPEYVENILASFSAEHWVTEMAGDAPTDMRLALSQIESKTYLRNQLLRDSDWASMAHSIELRTPLVDAKLLQDLAPFLGNVHQFPNKSLLSAAPQNPLPPPISVRSKTGFGIPIERWLSDQSISGSYGSRGWSVEIAKQFNFALADMNIDRQKRLI